MKLIVAIIVYDRLENIEEWVRCWNMCHKEDAQFYVIHNYKSIPDIEKCKEICQKGGVNYIQRVNIGMDIGAFQDVCRERLSGFPNDWDYLLWITDDVIPMKKDFIRFYLEASKKRSPFGVACLEVSHEVKTHIRTTGFMINKETSRILEFPADPIIDRMECYDFEHRSGNAFYEQMERLRKATIQVEYDLRKAPLWDSHIRGYLERWNEHYREFPKNE